MNPRRMSLLLGVSFVAKSRFSLCFSVGGRSIVATNRSRSNVLLGANPQDEEEPRTGWLHKSPSKKQQEAATNNHNKELRTGWLHRAEPRQVEEAQQQTQVAAVTSVPPKPTTVDLALKLQNDMMRDFRNHRILCPPTCYPSGEQGRTIVISEHVIRVPLKRTINTDFKALKQEEYTMADSQQPTIDVYFSVVDLISPAQHVKDMAFFQSLVDMDPKDRAKAYVQHYQLEDMDKGIIYLQGGPGFGAPAPISGIGLASSSSWAGSAFSNGFTKVVLMDQRGTGRSTPITKQTLQRRFPDLFSSDLQLKGKDNVIADALQMVRQEDAEQASKLEAAVKEAVDYMSHFRADNIVHDAEDVKDALLMPPKSTQEARPWGAALGQSFGGFCIMSYLSLIPRPPTICLLTGGIAPMCSDVRDVYQSLWNRVKERNLKYYKRYPGDVAVVKRIVQCLLRQPAPLPSGGTLTARRFLQLGMSLGGSPSSFASLHNTFNSAFVDDTEDIFQTSFLKYMDSAQPFDDHPIYFLMHESIYADGPSKSPTAWAAHSVFESMVARPSDFSYPLTSALNTQEKPTLFFGEMVFPWMADGDYAECSGFGLKALAEGLANKEDWTPLYHADNMRAALKSRTRAAAAVYTDDMYVDYDAVREVCKFGGPLEDCQLYITNEYQHSGLRDDGAAIFAKLLGMVRGSVGVPS